MLTDSICTHGRTAGQFHSQGTGTDLYIQNGTDPMASIRIPHQESAIGSTAWVKGHCFPAMGKCFSFIFFNISIFYLWVRFIPFVNIVALTNRDNVISV